MNNNKTVNAALGAVMLCFFCMGFVDLVGIASNYVKGDLNLSDSLANFLPSMVFFWFLIFSIPTSMLMNRIGRKNTVLLSLVITLVALLLPMFGKTFAIMICAFSLLGIGNTLMQTSLNPLVTCVVHGPTASTLTFGQFVKAIASFIAPYLAMWGATGVIPSFGYSWRILFGIFFVVGILSTLLLYTIHIEEPKSAASGESITEQFVSAFRLLGSPVVLWSFIGIVSCVGIDVGSNITAPKILIERLGISLNEAAFATSLYFIFRTVGCFTGSFFLRVMKTRTFFALSVVLMILSMACLAVGTDKWVLYAGIALVGYGNSNIFPMCFATALQAVPEKQNEVSGLMIMGLFGGFLFPMAMGLASDSIGQIGAVVCLSVGVVYLLCYTRKVM